MHCPFLQIIAEAEKVAAEAEQVAKSSSCKDENIETPREHNATTQTEQAMKHVSIQFRSKSYAKGKFVCCIIKYTYRICFISSKCFQTIRHYYYDYNHYNF